jgi:hypothetical protein
MFIKILIKNSVMANSKNITNRFQLYVDAKSKAQITEQFKSDTPMKMIKFPAELGEEHPFDFKTLEGIYKNFGPATGVVDKYVDFIVGPGFYVTSKNAKAQTIIEDFMHDVNFDTVLRQWVKQALVKGTSPMELGIQNGKIVGLKVLNADYIYIKRNKKGEIIEYNQYVGDANGFQKSKVNTFKPNEIAFLVFNQMGDSPYGNGILMPTMRIVDNILKAEKDMHMLMGRKANSPLHIKLGNMEKDDIPTDEEVMNFGQKLEYMTNKQEWCTGPNVEMTPIDFGNLSDKFTSVLEHDMRSFLYTTQVPQVLMGEGNIPEGLAGVQLDAFSRRNQSFQAEIEKIVELQIFEVVLESNGLQADVEMEWGQPSVAEKNDKIARLTLLLQNPMLSPVLIDEIELQLAELLGIDVEKLQTPEAQRAKEEKRSQPVIPGQRTPYGAATGDPKPVPKMDKPPMPPKEFYHVHNTTFIEGELIR